MSVVLEKELPKGWMIVKIHDVVASPKKDIVDGPFGSNLKATEYVDNGIPIIRLQNIDRNNFINKNIRYISEKKADQLRRHSFKKNDIVITKLGEPVGKACLVPDYLEEGIIVADILRMRISDEFIHRKFLMYLLNSKIIIGQFSSNTRGTTRPRVNLTKFRDFFIPLPPINEQKRIIAKIEELFSLVDSVKENLEKTKILLKQYRQSILKHAFEGKLVPQDPNDEPASVLLEKIKKEKPSQKTSNIVLEKSVSLPDNWTKAKLEIVINKITNGTTETQTKEETEYPVSRIETISNESIDYDRVRYLKKPSNALIEKYALQQWDILFSNINSDIHLGKTAIFYEGKTLIHGMNLLLIRPEQKIIDPKFLNFHFKYYRNIGKFVAIAQHAVNQSSINQTKLKNMEFIVPPLNEQKRIVAKIEESFSIIEKNEKLVDSLLLQYSQIKNSILKQAFKGKLVPQDPNDEPAQILLEKIQQERKKNGK